VLENRTTPKHCKTRNSFEDEIISLFDRNASQQYCFYPKIQAMFNLFHNNIFFHGNLILEQNLSKKIEELKRQIES